MGASITNWASEDKNFARAEAQKVLDEHKKTLGKMKVVKVYGNIPTWIEINSKTTNKQIKDKKKKYKEHFEKDRIIGMF